MLFYTTLFLVFWALIMSLPAKKNRRRWTFFSLIRSMERKEVLRSLFPGSRQSGIRLGAGSGSAIMRKKTALCTLLQPETRRGRSCSLIWL